MAHWFHRFFPPYWKPQESARQAAVLSSDCHAINLASGGIDPSKRVQDFGVSAPNCRCELQTTSPHSQKPVSDDEVLTRFIFSPIHVSKKNGKVLPSAFSHAATKGCSVQRENLATLAELQSWLGTYSKKNSAHTWMGTLACDSKLIRGIQLNDMPHRIMAVYDTAEEQNEAHAEIFQTEYVIEDSDRIEARAELLKRFDNGILTQPPAYRAGALCC